MDKSNRWTGKDIAHVVIMSLITVLFALRRGPILEAGLVTLRYLLAYFIYGLVTVLVFVGLTKKIFKLNPSRKQMIKWAFGLAAFFSVNQAIHEAFLAFTGQTLP